MTLWNSKKSPICDYRITIILKIVDLYNRVVFCNHFLHLWCPFKTMHGKHDCLFSQWDWHKGRSIVLTLLELFFCYFKIKL